MFAMIDLVPLLLTEESELNYWEGVTLGTPGRGSPALLCTLGVEANV